MSKLTTIGCDDDSSVNCTLTCDGEGDGEADGLLTYTWLVGEKKVAEGPTLIVEKKDKEVVYTCELSNTVSHARSSVTVPSVSHLENKGQKTWLDVYLLTLILSVFFINDQECHIFTLQVMEIKLELELELEFSY